MRKAVWSHAARKDIEAIELYWQDARPDYVRQVLVAGADATVRLAEHPALGARVEGGSFRKFRLGRTPYLLIYEYDDRMVRVLRVRHQREDWSPRG